MRFANFALAAALVSTASAFKFNTILIVVFENTNYADVIADPNFKKFASGGNLFSNWTAASHPSRPNYVYLASGSTHGIDSDDLITVKAKNIVDLLEEKQLTWRSYEEGFPGGCFTGKTFGRWAEKHSLALEFADVKNNPRRCANIVEAGQLAKDIKKKDLVNVAMYTPNLDNDAHDTNITYAGKWFKKFLADTAVVSHFDVVMATFDEDKTPDKTNNHIYTAIQGKAVVIPGTVYNGKLDHGSFLKTVELNFGLNSLGSGDKNASAFPIF